MAYSPSAAADIAAVDIEDVYEAIETGTLTARYAGSECVVLRKDLERWVDANKQRSANADDSSKDDLIRTLRTRINELEHQILAADPFLPGAALRKHSACMAAPTPSHRQAKHLYFMRCEGYVKIGVSQDPQRRLTQIRGGSSLMPVGMDYRTAEIVHIEPNAGAREYPTHWQFAHLRHTGEWFTEAPELTEYIEALKEAA